MEQLSTTLLKERLHFSKEEMAYSVQIWYKIRQLTEKQPT